MYNSFVSASHLFWNTNLYNISTEAYLNVVANPFSLFWALTMTNVRQALILSLRGRMSRQVAGKYLVSKTQQPERCM